MKGKIKCLLALFTLSLVFMLTGVKAEASTLTQVTCEQNKIGISWDAVYGATGYIVKVEYSDGSTAKYNAGTYTNGTLTNLNPGNKYYVSIYYVKNNYEYFHTGAYCYTLPSKVTGLKLTGYVEIYNRGYFTWNSLYSAGQTGISGYEYIVYNYKGTQVYKGDFYKSYNSDYCSYLKPNSVYKVVMRAYVNVNGVRKYGPDSDPCTVVPHARTKGGKNKNKVINGTLKASWTKVKGATGYDIYVSQKSNTGYKKVKSVGKNKTSVVLTKDNKGKSFKYNKYYYFVIVPKMGKTLGIKPAKNINFAYNWVITRSYWYW